MRGKRANKILDSLIQEAYDRLIKASAEFEKAEFGYQHLKHYQKTGKHLTFNEYKKCPIK
jgi:hypothetical protein